MIRWQYWQVMVRQGTAPGPDGRVVHGYLVSQPGEADVAFPSWTDALDFLGARGWELVATEGGCYTFKRPLDAG